MFIQDDFWDGLTTEFSRQFMDACFEAIQDYDMATGLVGGMDDYAMYFAV